MRPCGVQGREARTLAGPLHYERTVWECPACRRSEAPLDVELGVESGQKMSRALVRKVAWSAAQGSFVDAAANVREMIGLEVSPAECQRVGLEVGARVEKRQREQEALRLAPVAPDHRAAPPEIAAQRLVIEADATAVLTRPGEDHKMVWCGRAFALEDRGCKEAEGESPGRRFIAPSRHTAGASDFEDFTPRLKALGYRMGMRSSEAVAFVADGQACLWKWAGANLPPGTVMIQDFWHVQEHLAGICRDVFGEEPRTSPRLARWKTALGESRAGEIVEELRAEFHRRRGAKRQRLGEEIGYLENGADRMDYARYRAEGWPVGSGAIEADCKHLIKERFNLSGARWRRAGIAPILALRVAIFNEDWEAMWARN